MLDRLRWRLRGNKVPELRLTFGMTCVSSSLLNKLNTSYIFIQFGMLLTLIIALAAGTPSELKNSASFVFADFENTSYGWNNGWAVIITVAFCMGSDVIGIVTSPLGQPLAQIASIALGRMAVLHFWYSCGLVRFAIARF